MTQCFFVGFVMTLNSITRWKKRKCSATQLAMTMFFMLQVIWVQWKAVVEFSVQAHLRQTGRKKRNVVVWQPKNEAGSLWLSLLLEPWLHSRFALAKMHWKNCVIEKSGVVPTQSFGSMIFIQWMLKSYGCWFCMDLMCSHTKLSPKHMHFCFKLFGWNWLLRKCDIQKKNKMLIENSLRKCDSSVFLLCDTNKK